MSYKALKRRGLLLTTQRKDDVMWILVMIGISITGEPIEKAWPREFTTKAACEEFKAASPAPKSSVCVEK